MNILPIPMTSFSSTRSNESTQSDSTIFSPTELEYTISLAQDLEDALSVDDSFTKEVKFEPGSPTEVVYTVSSNKHEHDMRRVGKLFPIRIPQSVTVPEIVECSETLKSAAVKAAVTPRSDYHIEDCEQTPSILSPQRHPNSMTPHSESPDSDDDEDALSLMATSPRTGALIDLYIDQRTLSAHRSVQFDKVTVTPSNDKNVLMSSKGLTSGEHEWTIEILRTDVNLQEIGVIGVGDIDHIPVSDFGAFDTVAFQSRALYGCGLAADVLFYGSLNADNKPRCTRDLTPFFKRGWTVGTLITVKLNLNTFRIKFMINGKAVKCTMSLEPNKEYWPIICFSGNCQYALHY